MFLRIQICGISFNLVFRVTSTDLSVEQPRPQRENVGAAGEGQGGVGIYHGHLGQVLAVLVVLEVDDGGVEEDVVDVDFLGMTEK